jgi:hypothetical protein
MGLGRVIVIPLQWNFTPRALEAAGLVLDTLSVEACPKLSAAAVRSFSRRMLCSDYHELAL